MEYHAYRCMVKFRMNAIITDKKCKPGYHHPDMLYDVIAILELTDERSVIIKAYMYDAHQGELYDTADYTITYEDCTKADYNDADFIAEQIIIAFNQSSKHKFKVKLNEMKGFDKQILPNIDISI